MSWRSLTIDETGNVVPQLYQKENTKILPGYYVDVDLRYDFTETAGLYVGNIYQGGGSYSQSVPSGTTLPGPTGAIRHVLFHQDRFRRPRGRQGRDDLQVLAALPARSGRRGGLSSRRPPAVFP